MKIIDAKDKTIGRVASQVAKMLMEKDSASYTPNKTSTQQVQIINASLAKINFKKKIEKEYTRYSGYPGGIKYQTLGDLISKKGYGEVFRKAVYGMLPKNTLKNQRMKNLIIKD
ncbi:MAG TPA: 50S ribosomal protein L13 [Candidatus Paceibacterota bacterium]|nr:50S ribosomal protein L13 [Candidatus Paceibacterota bacterium]HMP18750.1 50S ribosomal protein L13 [Candidatus Paceibacterota bacterium]HMP85311.1 50S ribosomal protein L13 [Candidatus Paceibacterota bacterium]